MALQIKSLVRSLLRLLGYKMLKLKSPMTADARFGIDVFGLVVDEFMRSPDVKTLSILQIGANDGRHEDPVFPLIERHPCHAVVVEPLPDQYAALSDNYKDFDSVVPVRSAVSNYDGELSLFRIEPSVNSPHATKIASFDRSRVERYCDYWKIPKSEVVKEIVPCKTIETLLSEVGMSEVCVVVVDAEGMDYQICIQVLDLERLPDIIHFEYNYMLDTDFQILVERLTRQGYLFARSGLDVTAWRTQ